MPVSEFRRALWSQLIERGLISKPPSTTRSGNEGDGERDDDDDDEEGFKRVRVREKAHHRATKVFRDGKTLIDVVPNFYENKEIAVQVYHRSMQKKGNMFLGPGTIWFKRSLLHRAFPTLIFFGGVRRA